MRSLAVLGATGSIGTQTLNIIAQYPDRFRASVLTAYRDKDKLFALARAFKPDAAGLVVEPSEIPDDLRGIEWFFGPDASERAVRAVRPDDALAAVVGIAGLGAVLAALDVCKRVLLANKEALVTGGKLVTDKARENNVALLPVDSEHSAIFQCLQAANANPVERLLLTASGGPFRTWNKKAIASATVQDALGHPTWRMGAKITVDCATMMNKGLEVIEAHHLFGLPADQIDVVVHPQSVVHSMVEFTDGCVLAQLGMPDMRAAIGYAMGYPERVPFGGERLNWTSGKTLTFEAPDTDKFPCLRYAYDALKSGAAAPITLNGANEEAVAAFLAGRIPFGGIERVADSALQRASFEAVRTSEDVYRIDRDARTLAKAAIEKMAFQEVKEC